jgi:hypothetical protein
MFVKNFLAVALMCVATISSAETYQCQFTELSTPSSGGYKPYKGEFVKVDFNQSKLTYGNASFSPVKGKMGVPGPMDSSAFTFINSNGDPLTIFKTKSNGVKIAITSQNNSYVGSCQ